MVYNCKNFDFKQINHPKYISIGSGKNKHKYLIMYCGFDIETTNISDIEKSFMYHWQFQIDEFSIIGRTWNDLINFFENLKNRLCAPNVRLIVWVANLGYEFQFMRHHFSITEMFAKKKYEPLKFLLEDFFEFHEALAISGGSLEQLAKDYCTTQKNHDLDYSILRNSQTKLNEKELQYTLNDVIILKEFSEFIFKNIIIPQKYIPLTKTGILRHNVKERSKIWCKENGLSIQHLYDFVKSLFPKSKIQYNLIMEYLFRGGFTHANRIYVDEIIKDNHLFSIDFTSSYPATMFQNYVPITPFINSEFKNEYLDKYCCIMHAFFYNIDSTTTHAIESKNKIISHKKGHFDNGRLIKAEEIEVILTELDFFNYQKFYKWQSVAIKGFKIAKRGRLPRYLLDELYENYKGKKDLKNKLRNDNSLQGEYNIVKSNVNAGYGLCVTRLNFSDVTYNNEWDFIESEKTYDEMISKQILSPFWGIWITAHSRFKELSTLKLLNKHVIYSDTDSHKLIGFDCVYIIKEYNNSIIRLNHKMCEHYGYDKKYLLDIGTFDVESVMNRLKTLGSKRYIYEINDKIYSTISGLNKKSLMEYCNDNNINAFEFFNDKMRIPSDYTHKLTTKYIDEPTEYIIDGEKMCELSSIVLVPCEFNLSLDVDYIELLISLYERNKRRF